jgi:phosphoribosylanthranilate isomerase
MTKVKICGITNLEDAIVAVDAGADYLGFIFFPPSKRSITQPACQAIVSALRSRPDCPILVGVFVNETAAHMAHIMQECDLDLAQLSGEEVPALIADQRSPLYGRSYKGLRPATLAEAEVEAEWYIALQHEPDHPTLLIDTYHPTLHGGTGETGDWEMSAKLARTIPGLMLAGGLNVGNITAAVRQVHPFAVDVASGVESTPGKKNHQTMRQFIHRARAA